MNDKQHLSSTALICAFNFVKQFPTFSITALFTLQFLAEILMTSSFLPMGALISFSNSKNNFERMMPTVRTYGFNGSETNSETGIKPMTFDAMTLLGCFYSGCVVHFHFVVAQRNERYLKG